MTRRALLPAILAALTLLPSAHAAPAPQLTDARGDAIPGWDILSGRLSSVRVKGVAHLRGELRLDEVPYADGPMTYRMVFWNRARCLRYAFTYDWRSLAELSEATITVEDGCPLNSNAVGRGDSFPVSFALRGTTLTFTIQYFNELAAGVRLSEFSATSCHVVCGDGWTIRHGDWASAPAHRSYVVGSDLPRR